MLNSLLENNYTRRTGALSNAGRAISADGARSRKIYDPETGQYHYEGGTTANSGNTLVGLGDWSHARWPQRVLGGRLEFNRRLALPSMSSRLVLPHPTVTIPMQGAVPEQDDHPTKVIEWLVYDSESKDWIHKPGVYMAGCS